MDRSSTVHRAVKAHYEKHVYPRFPLLTSLRLCDTYALNLDALWARFNGERLDRHDKKILLAGCGSFSPYPTALANPKAQITALDLSKANLDRAKLHTWLHRRFNVDFVEGDLLGAKALLGERRFHFIDCYGVLHHIPDAGAALQTLHSLLDRGAILRLMVYSAPARRSVQAARTALRILGIADVAQIKALYKKAKDSSRFRGCIESAYEARFDWGLADLFLHPYAKTYTLHELLEALQQARLEPIQFIHPGALPDVDAEIQRLERLEANNALASNFMLFAGRAEDSQKRLHWRQEKKDQDTLIALNPAIQKSLPLLPFIPLKPGPKLGFENPVIGFKANRLLARFKRPLRKSALGPDRWTAIQPYLHALFLTETSAPP
ncbi:MAG: methyltransferase domain-containing protein [Candidatus Competibacteraceae bacterium]|nr:methyltransferase domain-containing protein [Candidatus Competibacteraceae bacterium]